jgi:FMN-dependent NADH-azoreductase
VAFHQVYPVHATAKGDDIPDRSITMKILHLDSSALGDRSTTRILTAAVVERVRTDSEKTIVSYRDLDTTPLLHLSAAQLSGAHAEAAAQGEQVLSEFLQADLVVIGAPTYNFGIPSTLKAWIDRIAVAGRTFRYTADGPQGLAGGKRIIVATAAGGMHAGQPTDFAEPYLRQVLGFLGIDDITVVRADGVALSPGHHQRAVDVALTAIDAPFSRAA